MLSHKCQTEGRSTSLVLLATLLLLQPSMWLTTFAAKSHCWLMFSLLFRRTPSSFSAKLLSGSVPTLQYCMVLFHPRCRTAFSLVEFHKMSAHFSSLSMYLQWQPWMEMLKSTSPNINAQGMPLINSHHLTFSLFFTNFVIHPDSPYISILAPKMLQETKSKACQSEGNWHPLLCLHLQIQPLHWRRQFGWSSTICTWKIHAFYPQSLSSPLCAWTWLTERFAP